MKIYTKTGDKGETSLFGGQRVPKDALRIEAYGTVDELNASIGVVRSFGPKKDVDQVLEQIQHDLFVLGADLATPPAKEASTSAKMDASRIASLESWIDAFDSQLPKLTAFILPSGGIVASHLHVARTVCRRSERAIVKLMHNEPIDGLPLIYLNRLSDLLFVLARIANSQEGEQEVLWKNPPLR